MDLTVSVDLKKHLKKKKDEHRLRAQELRESVGGHPGLPRP